MGQNHFVGQLGRPGPNEDSLSSDSELGNSEYDVG